jgi:site-specific DNA-methyltransferase (adenine-specific)
MLKLEETQYNTLSISQIKKLPIKEITETDCACFLWCVDSFFKEGIELLEEWGFKYKTIAFNWIKTYESGKFCVNFAPWTLKSWEICLLGLKGQMGKYKKANNIQGLITSVRTKHSKKPDIIRDKIVELFGDIPRIELFARQKTEGWDIWGNELENSVEL